MPSACGRRRLRGVGEEPDVCSCLRIVLGVDQPAVIARPVRRRARVRAGLQENLLRSARHAPDVASPRRWRRTPRVAHPATRPRRCGLSGGVVSTYLLVSFQVLHPQRGRALRVGTPERRHACHQAPTKCRWPDPTCRLGQVPFPNGRTRSVADRAGCWRGTSRCRWCQRTRRSVVRVGKRHRSGHRHRFAGQLPRCRIERRGHQRLFAQEQQSGPGSVRAHSGQRCRSIDPRAGAGRWDRTSEAT